MKKKLTNSGVLAHAVHERQSAQPRKQHGIVEGSGATTTSAPRKLIEPSLSSVNVPSSVDAAPVPSGTVLQGNFTRANLFHANVRG